MFIHRLAYELYLQPRNPVYFAPNFRPSDDGQGYVRITRKGTISRL